MKNLLLILTIALTGCLAGKSDLGNCTPSQKKEMIKKLDLCNEEFRPGTHSHNRCVEDYAELICTKKPERRY